MGLRYLIVVRDLVEGAEQTSVFWNRMGTLPSTSYGYQYRASEIDIVRTSILVEIVTRVDRSVQVGQDRSREFDTFSSQADFLPPSASLQKIGSHSLRVQAFQWVHWKQWWSE